MSHTDRLKYLRLHSLKERRIRGDIIQMFKIFHGYDDIDMHVFFSSTCIFLHKLTLLERVAAD